MQRCVYVRMRACMKGRRELVATRVHCNRGFVNKTANAHLSINLSMSRVISRLRVVTCKITSSSYAILKKKILFSTFSTFKK